MSKLYTTNIKSEDKRDLLTDNFVPEDLKMMAKSTQLLLLLAASWLTLNQAAPAPLGLLSPILNNAGTSIKRSELSASSSQHDKLTNNIYYCFEGAGDMTNQQSMESGNCSKMMEGERSSNNESIPQGSDTVEMFISSVATKQGVMYGDYTYDHAVQLVFDVSAIYETGAIQKTEVRIFHMPVARDSHCANHIHLKLININTAHVIDEVNVNYGHEGWVIFDSVNYTWKTMEETYEHTVAIVVTSNCTGKSLTDLGFHVDDGRQPILVVFSSQEQVMTEVSILPPSFVKNVLSSVPSKRDVENARDQGCHLEPYIVNLAEIGLSHIALPKAIKMNKCVGKCRDPVAPNNRNSLYAAFLARAARQLNHDHHPCCVPVAYNKVTLFYVLSSSTTIVQKAEVSASECGCR